MPLTPSFAFGDQLPSHDTMASLAGYYWQRLYPQQDQIQALTEAWRQEHRQTVRLLNELAEAATYTQCPLWHVETFWPLVIPVSEIQPAVIRYGEGYTYNDRFNGETIAYGTTDNQWWQAPRPASLVGAAAACDRPYGSGMLLPEHSGFRPGAHFLYFADDPRQWATRTATADGQEAVVIWLYMARFERRYLAERFGRLARLELPSGRAYKKAIAALMQAWTQGGSEWALRQLLAAAADVDLAEQGETVVRILTGARPAVITDRRTVYGQVGDTPLVAVDAVLDQGDSFFDSLRFTAFEGGHLPAWMTSLRLPAGITGAKGDVTIPAGELVTSAYYDANNRLRIEFPILGTAIAVQSFWDRLNAVQPGQGTTFSQLIMSYAGQPVSDTTQPGPASIPAAVDLLGMLASQWLRYGISASLVRVPPSNPQAARLFDLIRHVVPPWTLHLVTNTSELPEVDISALEYAWQWHDGTQPAGGNRWAIEPIDSAEQYLGKWKLM